jgi:hypothetical protein
MVAITQRQWWIGVAVLTAAILAHAIWPRYEWRDPGYAPADALYLRIDRWTGTSEMGKFQTSGPNLGQWRSLREATLRTPQ